MVNPIGSAGDAANGLAAARLATAADVVVNNARTGTRIDVTALATEIAGLRTTNPALAAASQMKAEAQLSPVERGQLARSLDGPAPSAATPSTPTPGVNTTELALDVTQIALDIVGIVEPTPFADGANTLISLGRGDWLGAGLSVVGVIPYVGDAAKLGKLGKWAETAANAAELAVSNPAAFKALEPALRKLSDAVGALPLDKLPASARETLSGMKTRIDDALAVAARPSIRNADGSLNLAEAAKRYGEAVATNKQWSWARNFEGDVTRAERVAIRDAAVAGNLVPSVGLKPGTRYPDFAAANLVRKVDSLPGELYHASDSVQFAWLDSRIPGGRPDGMTWHHTEIPGRMELVPFGPHNTINHIGGRSPGHWAAGPR